MNFKINNRTGQPIKYEKEIHSLCGFAQKRLGFEKPPSIFLNDDSKNASNTLGKTGYYDPNTMEIHVFATGRHPKDILRSIAHELVHHNQHMNGELDMVGYSGKGYAQKNPKLRKAEMEANDPMLFRDWEDGIKEKSPTIYNERRNKKMSLKDWKNKELSENLSRKWGFKMDLSKLKEGFGEEKYGMQDIEAMEPPMDMDEVNAIQMCVDQKVAQGVPMEIAGQECEKEIQAFMDREGRVPREYHVGSTPGENPEFSNMFEGKDKKITHMCALEVIHRRTGRRGHPIAHTLSESGQISHYSVEFSDVIVEHIPVRNLKIMVQEMHSHKRDDEKPHDKKKKKMSEKELEEAEKPDFPDIDGDGDREESISKAQKDKKAKGGDKEKSGNSSKKGKMPAGLAKYHASKKGNKKEEIDEAAIGGDKSYLEKLLSKYGSNAKIGDVAKKEKEAKKIDETNAMGSGAVQGHAGKKRRRK